MVRFRWVGSPTYVRVFRGAEPVYVGVLWYSVLGTMRAGSGIVVCRFPQVFASEYMALCQGLKGDGGVSRRISDTKWGAAI